MAKANTIKATSFSPLIACLSYKQKALAVIFNSINEVSCVKIYETNLF